MGIIIKIELTLVIKSHNNLFIQPSVLVLCTIKLLPVFGKGLDLSDGVCLLPWLAPGIRIQLQHAAKDFLKLRSRVSLDLDCITQC